MDAFPKKKRTTEKSDDKLFDQSRDQYSTSSERSEQGDYSKPCLNWKWVVNHPLLPLKSLALRVFMRITHREEVTA